MYDGLKTRLRPFLIRTSHLSQLVCSVRTDCPLQHRWYYWTTIIPNKTLRTETLMVLWCHLVLITRRTAEPRRKDRRAGCLNGSISLCSNSRRRRRRTRRGRRDRGRNIRRRLNDKGKRTRRRWTNFCSGFLKRQQIDGNKFLRETHQIEFIWIGSLSKCSNSKTRTILPYLRGSLL